MQALQARNSSAARCAAAPRVRPRHGPMMRPLAPARLALLLRASAARPAAAAAPPHVQKAPVVSEPQAPPAEPTTPSSWQDKITAWARSAAKMAGVAALAAALVLGRCDAAHAARSAGRAGGFSAPSASRGYSGGGGGGYSGGSSYGGGYSGGLRSYGSPYSSGYRSTVVVPAPPIVVGPPVGLYGSPAYGAAVVSTGPDLVDIAIVSMFLVMAAGAATSALRGGGDDGGSGMGGRPTLTRVQVGLLSLARELKGDLDRIAARADTSDSRGLHQLLQEVVLALLRNPAYCVYGGSSQRSAASASALEAAFNSASLKERSKFEQETLVNVAGGGGARRRAYAPAPAAASKPDELVVVTLLVATCCGVAIPEKINSLAELRSALEALGGLPQDQVLGVELLWTPQAEGDYFTRDELVADYPQLRQL